MDIKDVPQEVREDLEFILVETIEEVIKETIGIELPKVAMLQIAATEEKNNENLKLINVD
ncbi:hypothetical protein D3C81_1939320 [compost metagenome]